MVVSVAGDLRGEGSELCICRTPPILTCAAQARGEAPGGWRNLLHASLGSDAHVTSFAEWCYLSGLLSSSLHCYYLSDSEFVLPLA